MTTPRSSSRRRIIGYHNERVQAAESSSSLIGASLEERYSIVREVGRGGMGVVYEAEHVELGKRVAIKVMLDKYANDQEAIARFKREALAMLDDLLTWNQKHLANPNKRTH